MGRRLNLLKPAAPLKWHLAAGAMMWTTTGSALLGCGLFWVVTAPTRHAAWWLLLALPVGLIKGRFVLAPAADRTIARIMERGDGRCLGGFLSVRTWLLVVVMATAGRLVRGGLGHGAIAGLIYVIIGTALLYGSRRFCVAWYRHKAST